MDMPPEVRIGLISAGVVITIAVLLLVFGDRPELAAAIRRRLAGRASDDMSTYPERPTAPARPANQSVDQSAPTSLERQTSAPPASGLEGPDSDDPSDMDTEQTTWQAPRVSPYLTDNEFIVFLATQKLRSGKYRLSANDIVKAVRGDRTQVLAIVREVREAPAEFKPLTPEQAQVREQLQLGER